MLTAIPVGITHSTDALAHLMLVVQSQAHKLAIIGGLRERSGRAYELVWRNRPDMVSVGHNWTRIKKFVEHFRCSEKALDRSVLVPPLVRTGYMFEDIDLLLSVAAARHLEKLWFALPTIYHQQTSFHPERLLQVHMQRGNVTREVHALPDVYIYRCVEWCRAHSNSTVDTHWTRSA